MIRSLLQGAGLGSEYWSYALRHAVYLKNRLPHRGINKFPYEAMNGQKPNLSHLRVFGSKVTVQNEDRKAKLDPNNTQGLFMTFAGTDKNVCIIDAITGREKIATHASFDEVHMSSAFQDIPPYASALQRAGYRPRLDIPYGAEMQHEETEIKYKILSESAVEPTRSNKHSMKSEDSNKNWPGWKVFCPTMMNCSIFTFYKMEVNYSIKRTKIFLRTNYSL